MKTTTKWLMLSIVMLIAALLAFSPDLYTNGKMDTSVMVAGILFLCLCISSFIFFLQDRRHQ